MPPAATSAMWSCTSSARSARVRPCASTSRRSGAERSAPPEQPLDLGEIGLGRLRALRAAEPEAGAGRRGGLLGGQARVLGGALGGVARPRSLALGLLAALARRARPPH